MTLQQREPPKGSILDHYHTPPSEHLVHVHVDFELSIGHTLHMHGGKCRNLHGHNYQGRLDLAGFPDSVTGMVVDFGAVKTLIIRELKQEYDHKFLVDRNDPLWDALKAHNLSGSRGIVPMDYPPTVENLVYEMSVLVKKVLVGYGSSDDPHDQALRFGSLTLMETEACGATIHG